MKRVAMPKWGWRSVGSLMLCMTVGCAATPSASTSLITAGQTELSPVDSARLCLHAAYDFERQGYDREAIAQYERARRFDPVANVTATRRLAVLYGRTGNTVAAVAAYDAALATSPVDASLLNDAGYFRLSEGDAVGAVRLLRRAVLADPHYGRARVNLGLALAALGRWDDSYASFATVLPAAQARANVGVELARQGQYGLASGALSDALQQDPTLEQARVALEWADRHHDAPTTRPVGHVIGE